MFPETWYFGQIQNWFSLALNRKIAYAIVEGARIARGGERLLSCGHLNGRLQLFESEQPFWLWRAFYV
jgi:hypothetical protein